MIFSRSIPFVIPKEFARAGSRIDPAAGILRRGALLMDESTGRILGHLQETGALRELVNQQGSGGLGKLVDVGLSLGGGPLDAATGIYGLVQNEQIKARLAAMQTMMGNLQTLQIATLASSVVGIGVTVASTMMILKRLRDLKTDLARIEDAVDRIPAQLTINTLIDVLIVIETQLERLEEASVRRNPRPVLEEAEAALHEGFNAIVTRLQMLQGQGGLDAAWLAALFRGLALCGAAQSQVLLQLDDAAALVRRTRGQIGKLEQLAFTLPQDVLEIDLGIAPPTAERLAAEAAETRLRFASTLMLAEQLQVQSIPGPKYLAKAAAEEEQPLLVLPHVPARQAV